MSENTISRSLHDVGLAAWFGGTLMGAVGLNGGAAAAKDEKERAAIASAGWAKWTPVNFAAIAAHVVGSVGMLIGDKGRVAGQEGVAPAALLKVVLTAAALGATGYARMVGRKIQDLSPAASDGVTEPSFNTPPELAEAQQHEKMLQWAVPALTGALVVLSAKMGEQQRATSVVGGAVGRVRKLVS